jgi:diaminohydroxyphosphoribosylaminopyrimidine deaminase/5-amino-6-(5-phosphoribosylamino)uracil reductase
MVGAVVVQNGRLIAEGWHAEYGGPHAEVVALERAGDAARGATLYVTLEPCNHTGKTPPCAPRVIASGVRRVVFAARDPNPAAAGGAGAMREAGLIVEEGLEGEKAWELNAAFHARFSLTRPFITLKLAVSIDGAIAAEPGKSGWLTGPKARRDVHVMRAGHDAVAVGSTTAIVDDPQLTVRGVRSPRVPPVRVVFDREGRLPVTSKLVKTAGKWPTLVVTRDTGRDALRAHEQAGVRLLAAGSLMQALERLREAGINSMLIEGGATLAGALLAAGVVDRLVIFQAPVVLGPGARRAFDFGIDPAGVFPSYWVARERRVLDGDIKTTYASATLPPIP